MLDPLRRLVEACPREALVEVVLELLNQNWPAAPSRQRLDADQGGRGSQAGPAVDHASRPPVTAPIPSKRRRRLGRRRERKGAPRPPSRPRRRYGRRPRRSRMRRGSSSPSASGSIPPSPSTPIGITVFRLAFGRGRRRLRLGHSLRRPQARPAFPPSGARVTRP